MPTVSLADIRKQYPQYQDMSDEQLAEGLHRKFYSDMPREQFNERIGLTAQPTEQNAPQIGTDALTASTRRMLPFQDEIMAGMAAVPAAIGSAVTGGEFDVGAEYSQELERQRALQSQASEEHPVATTLGEIAGGVALGGTLAKGGATLLNAARPTAASMVGRGAAEGAAYGSVYGFAEGEGREDRIDRAITGAGIGAATGGALGAVGAGQASKAARASIPTADDIKAQSQKLYDVADQAGLVVKPESYRNMVLGMWNKLLNSGFDHTLHPRASAALRRLAEVDGEPLALKTIDNLRRVTAAAARSTEADERRIGSIMIDRIDDWLANLKPSDAVVGDAQAGAKAISQARQLWKQFRKAETIEEIFERAANTVGANYTSAGYQTAVRQGFKSLLQNKKAMRGFTSEERKAIQRVVRGGAVENILRMVGKFAPRGVVGTTLGGGLGYSVAGPAGSAAVFAAGEAARRGSNALASRSANAVSDLVRAGGQLPAVQQLSGPNRALLNSLLVSGSGPGQNALNGTSQ